MRYSSFIKGTLMWGRYSRFSRAKRMLTLETRVWSLEDERNESNFDGIIVPSLHMMGCGPRITNASCYFFMLFSVVIMIKLLTVNRANDEDHKKILYLNSMQAIQILANILSYLCSLPLDSFLSKHSINVWNVFSITTNCLNWNSDQAHSSWTALLKQKLAFSSYLLHEPMTAVHFN